jgi:hypothetical protein
MVGWNLTNRKKADEAVNAQNNEIAASGLDSEVYEGEVQLQITPFESFSQIDKYKKHLATIKDLKILSESWSEEEGFNIVVSVQVPLALGHLLQDMPEVACVRLSNNKKSGHHNPKHDSKKMLVVMKTSEVSLDPVPA